LGGGVVQGEWCRKRMGWFTVLLHRLVGKSDPREIGDVSVSRFFRTMLRNGIETMVFMVMHLFNGTFRIKHLGIVALAENEEDDGRTQREREEIPENCYK
jgi:hypothetical protein